MIRDLRKKVSRAPSCRYDAAHADGPGGRARRRSGGARRWGIGSWFGHRFPSFPWGTLVINVSGSFILGVLFAVLVQRNAGSPTMRVALMTGLLGAYTTFSTFSLETFRLFEDGATGSALANIGLSVCLGLLGVWLGITAGRAFA